MASKADPTTDDVVEGPEAYARFEALTRKLVRVPKDEIDEKRRKQAHPDTD